jgi:hypothetical protein
MRVLHFISLRAVHGIIFLLVLRGAARGAGPATQPDMDQRTAQMLQDWKDRLEQEHLEYLQEKGLLRDYYWKFRDDQANDPTGLQTLEKLIAPQEIGPFETEWRAWVLTLHWG